MAAATAAAYSQGGLRGEVATDEDGLDAHKGDGKGTEASAADAADAAGSTDCVGTRTCARACSTDAADAAEPVMSASPDDASNAAAADATDVADGPVATADAAHAARDDGGRWRFGERDVSEGREAPSEAG